MRKKNKTYYLIRYNCCNGFMMMEKVVDTFDDAVLFFKEYIRNCDDYNRYIEVFTVTKKWNKKEFEKVLVWF